MIAATLPSERRTIPKAVRQDPVGTNDVADIMGTMADQLFDISEHFYAMNRGNEAFALTRVALELGARSLYVRTTGKLRSTKAPDVVVTALRSAGTIDKDTLASLREVLGGRRLKEGDMARLVAMFRSACGQ